MVARASFFLLLEYYMPEEGGGQGKSTGIDKTKLFNSLFGQTYPVYNS